MGESTRPSKEELDSVEQQAGARHDDAEQRASVDKGEARLQRLFIDGLWSLNETTSRLTRWLIGLTWVLVILTALLVIEAVRSWVVK